MNPSQGRQGFSRREAQIMEILFVTGGASVNDVRDQLADAPSETAVRTLLGVLVRKGHVRRKRDGRRKIYHATTSRTQAGRRALQRVIEVFYDGSLSDALAAHFANPKAKPDAAEYARLSKLIRAKQKSGGAK